MVQPKGFFYLHLFWCFVEQIETEEIEGMGPVEPTEGEEGEESVVDGFIFRSFISPEDKDE